MSIDDLLQIRQANLPQIDRLAGLLQQPRLTEAEHSLVMSLPQVKTIEVGAIERFLPRGYRLVSGPGEAPRFAPAQPDANPGNENWARFRSADRSSGVHWPPKPHPPW